MKTVYIIRKYILENKRKYGWKLKNIKKLNSKF